MPRVRTVRYWFIRVRVDGLWTEYPRHPVKGREWVFQTRRLAEKFLQANVPNGRAARVEGRRFRMTEPFDIMCVVGEKVK